MNPAGGSQPLPNAGGYGGTLTYSSNNSTAGATMTLTTTTAATTVPNPQPTGTALAYYELVLSQSITFTNGLDTASLTLPPSLNTSGHTFYDTVYDQTAGVLIGNSQAGTVSGQTVNFTSGGNSTPLNGGDRYIVVLSET
ncbi:MAG: hypothetical protein ACREM6_05895 [Vulcanimicrobiaceae bacterium]